MRGEVSGFNVGGRGLGLGNNALADGLALAQQTRMHALRPRLVFWGLRLGVWDVAVGVYGSRLK